MKRTILFLALALAWLISPLQGQDLIDRVRKGVSVQETGANTSGKIAQLLLDRKQQRADFQAVSLWEFHAEDQTAAYKNTVSDAVFLRLNSRRLEAFLQVPARDLLLSIPVEVNRYITLEVTRVEIASKDFDVKTSSGKESLHQPTGVFYHGVVRGQPGAVAAVSFFGSYVRVLIADPQGNYVLAPMQAGRADAIFYNDRNLTGKPSFSCHAPSLPKGAHLHSSQDKAAPAADGDCVKVYFECDRAMYQSFGSSLVRVVDYVLGLFNEVAMLYSAENIRVEVSQIMVWTTPDPYVSATNTSEALELFGETLQNNYNGRLAHLLSTRNLGGGLAWIDVLCDSYFTFMADFDNDGVNELHHAGPYGVSAVDVTFQQVPVYSWSVMVVTHELGHNFGSPHTHACAWNSNNTQIDDCGNGDEGDGVFDSDNDGVADDGCYNPFAVPAQPRIIPAGGGTIMSYCHLESVGINLALGFGQQPGDLIRGRVSGAGCLSTECSCEEFVNRNVSGSPIPSAIYRASNSITSVGDADAPANHIVVFRAGNLIELLPGFEATQLFVAQVIPNLCDIPGALVGQHGAEALFPEQVLEPSPTLSVALFPNPASEQMFVEYWLPVESAVTIQLYTPYGQLLKTIENQTSQPAGLYRLPVSLSAWPAGMYYIVVLSGQERIVKPFVLQRT